MALFYDFKKGLTDRYLRSIGRKPRAVKSDFKRIEVEHFERMVQNEQAVLTETEAYILDENGNKQPVYFFKRVFSFFYNGQAKDPRFHVCKCSTIRDFGQSSFKASNKTKATVQNKSHRYGSGEPSYEVEMKLCGNCAKQVNDSARTTKEFYDRVFAEYQKNNPIDENAKVGFSGYTLDWSRISKIYREKMNYTCERCRVNLENNRRFLHTHHLNGNKLNNHHTNLQALCIKCHAAEHDYPENKFQKAKMVRELNKFRERYRREMPIH